LYGPADSGKTALFAALKQCFLGISSRLNRQDGGYCHVQYSREALTRRADRPNEALAELQVVRLAYGEEPSTNMYMIVDGAYLTVI
jgi:hypothetical protein